MPFDATFPPAIVATIQAQMVERQKPAIGIRETRAITPEQARLLAEAAEKGRLHNMGGQAVPRRFMGLRDKLTEIDHTQIYAVKFLFESIRDRKPYEGAEPPDIRAHAEELFDLAQKHGLFGPKIVASVQPNAEPEPRAAVRSEDRAGTWATRLLEAVEAGLALKLEDEAIPEHLQGLKYELSKTGITELYELIFLFEDIRDGRPYKLAELGDARDRQVKTARRAEILIHLARTHGILDPKARAAEPVVELPTSIGSADAIISPIPPTKCYDDLVNKKLDAAVASEIVGVVSEQLARCNSDEERYQILTRVFQKGKYNLRPLSLHKKFDEAKLPMEAPELWDQRDKSLRENAADFLGRVYLQWHGKGNDWKGLTRQHVGRLDSSLISAWAAHVSRAGKPSAYDLPTDKEVNDAELQRFSETELHELIRLGELARTRVKAKNKDTNYSGNKLYLG